ncbi:MAG TPA: hypothetical protein VG895_04105 [Patescibacteria group bacterium]|nr:hypothetical protein [Patescibacteria group bacterium]
MSGVETLLTIVVVALAILFIFVGVQVTLVILDLRRTIRRLNSLLEDAILGGGLIRPDKLTGVLEFFRKKRETGSHGQQI